MPTVSMPSDKRRTSADVSSTKTLSNSDSGIVQNVRASAAVITLPSTQAGLTFTFRVGGVAVTSGPQGAAGATHTVNVSPAAADGIIGLGLTGVINKDLILTGGAVGEEFTLVGTGAAGTGAWVIAEACVSAGTFTKEA
jgi:hypothetical protein